jgi:ribosome maturation factor RimP
MDMDGNKMNKLENQIYGIAGEIAKDLNLEIVSVEDVREHGMRIIRVIADKETGLTMEDSVALNEALSDKLDELDPIEGQYYLEVSSPGIERELTTDKDIYRAIGKKVYIKTYEKIAKEKEFIGILVDFDGETLSVDAKIKQFTKNVQIQKSQIAKIRLSV